MVSTATNQQYIPFDKLDPNEIKDLFVCFLYIVKNLSEGMWTIKKMFSIGLILSHYNA